jgi:hypothetical protein
VRRRTAAGGTTQSFRYLGTQSFRYLGTRSFRYLGTRSFRYGPKPRKPLAAGRDREYIFP